MSAGDHIWPDIAAALPGPRYRDVILVAQGAMGRIYRAWHEPSGAPVAVKVLPLLTESLVQRAERERRLLQRLGAHDNVVRFVDARLTTAPPSLILVLEWVEGPDLLTLIRSAGNLPEAVVAAIARQVCRGLAHLHAQRLLHRDVKPSNVLLTRAGVAKIADFGLLFGAEDEADEEGTRVGMTVGTPGFMAPELFLAAGRGHTERSDLYAVGSLIFHALAGRPVLEAATDYAQSMQAILSGKFDLSLPKGSAQGWTALIRDLLAPDPARRPGSAADVIERLDAVVPPDPRGDAPVVLEFFELGADITRGPARVPAPMLEAPRDARTVKDLLLSLRSEIAEIGAVVTDLTLVLNKARKPAPPVAPPAKSAPGLFPGRRPKTEPARPGAEPETRIRPGQSPPRTLKPAPASIPREELLDRDSRSMLSLPIPQPGHEPPPSADDESDADVPVAAAEPRAAPQAPDPIENRIEGTFSSIRDRLRATWRLGLVMTVVLFAVFVAMVVTAIITGLTTGKATLSIIFGGAGAASILGVVIWKPFDRIFFATVVLQQLEIIQLNYHRAMTGTRNERQAAFTDTLRQLDLLLTRILAQGSRARPEPG